MMSPDHWMQFGTFREQDYFEYPQKGTYAGVVINGNMAAHAPAGLAAFLLEKTARANYLVDPLTHAFQHDPLAVLNRDGGPKSSIVSLASAFGEPVAGLVGSKALLPDMLRDDAVLVGFVQRVVDFQYGHIVRFALSSEAAKYLTKEELDIRPSAVLAPYFFLSEDTCARWLGVNVRAVEAAAASRPGAVKLYSAVVVGRDVLNNEDLCHEILSAYSPLEVAGQVVWVDNFDEAQASFTELTAFLRLCRGLRAQGDREVLNLHGSYFSVLAAGPAGGLALSGVAHGPEFGEFRAVVPVGGGIPIARYYVPDLHIRVRYRDALRMFQAKGWLSSATAFHDHVCDCAECVATMRGDPANFVLFGESTIKTVRRRGALARIEFPTPEAAERCLRHYLQRKKREFDASRKAPLATLLEDLQRGAAKYEDVAGLEGVAHLRRWHRVLSA